MGKAGQKHGLPYVTIYDRPQMKRLDALCLIFLAVWSLLAIPAGANPIIAPNDEISILISWLAAFSFSLEIVCFLWVLRQSRKPRFFVLWLIAMHIVTYPAFLEFCFWLERKVSPIVAYGTGEVLVMLVEGLLTYLICRFIPSAESNKAAPSLAKCLGASLIGNLFSAMVFLALTPT